MRKPFQDINSEMARPKEHAYNAGYQSAAFMDKCLKENERIKTKIAQQLRDDVLRMLNEEIHTDLTVTNGNKKIKAHKSIFLTRVGSIFPELQNESEDRVSLNNLNSQDLETLVREVYYVEDVNYFYACRDYLPRLNGVTDKYTGNGSSSGVLINDIPDDIEPQAAPCENISDSPQSEEVNEGNIEVPCNSSSINNLAESNSGETDSNQNHKEKISELDGGHQAEEVENIQCKDTLQNGDIIVEDKQDLSKMIKLSYSLSLPHETCSKLGADLLRMFLQEIGCDATLVVDGNEFKAHRCILACRSSYFEAMFGGLWTESGADKVILEGVSACAVEQVLLYLYGGVIDVIEQCELTELLHVADMYGIEGLKDVVCFHLKKDSCHFFHKPCPTCETTAGHALTVAVTYRLEEVRERVLKWINKFFTKLVATKQFAMMPDSVLEICHSSLVDQLTDQTVIDMILECHKLTSKMPRVKWAEPVLDLTAKLMDSAIDFTSQHFVSVVRSQRFLQSGKSAAWSVSVLEDIFSNVIDALPPHKACEAYIALLNLYEYSISCDPSPWGEDMQSLLATLISYNETYMKHYIHQVTLSPAWRDLPTDIRERILKSASYVCIEQDLTTMTQPPQLSNKKNRDNLKSRGSPRQGPRPGSSRSTQKNVSNRPNTRTNNLRQTPERPVGAKGLLTSPRDKSRSADQSSARGQRSEISPPQQTSSHRTSSQSARGTAARSQTGVGKEMLPRVNGSACRPKSTSCSVRESPTKKLSTEVSSARTHQSTTSSRQQTTPPRTPLSTSRRQQTTPSRQPAGGLGNMSRQSLSPSPTARGSTRSRLPERIHTTLRPARSTGSLTRSRELRPSQRSVSTANLDTDAWGLERREHSTINLDKLVPILEMAFTEPQDGDT